ncbi:MAG: CvpA family protein, partial [Ferruginibacter sp.]
MAVDLILVTAVFIGFLWGYQRGILKTLMGFLSVAVGIMVCILLFRFGGDELLTNIDLSEMEQLAVILSLSMVAGWLITSLFGSLLNTIADKTMLGVPNRLIGGLFF